MSEFNNSITIPEWRKRTARSVTHIETGVILRKRMDNRVVLDDSQAVNAWKLDYQEARIAGARIIERQIAESNVND